MTKARTISEALAPLIAQSPVSLKAIASIGEMITMDARLLDHDTGARNRATHETLGLFLETYDELLQQTRSAVASFLETQDRQTLVAVLSEIKERLAKL